MSRQADDCSPFSRIGALSRIMNVGVLLLDPQAGLEFANPLACELLGFADDSLLKAEWTDVKALLDLDTALADIAKPRPLKVNYSAHDEQRLLRLEIYALDEEPCTGYLILLRDRRVVHALEADLLLASQMRAQSYLYGALLHDLRAPLNALQINVELLTESLGPRGQGLSPERYANVLREELTRLNRTLRTVLDGGAPLSRESQQFDLVATLQELEALLRPQAKRQRVEMRWQLPSQRVPIMGQRDSIKQAVLNVAINGLEAMPSGGVLEIRLDTREGVACIELKDSGSGVPEALLEDIYRIYFTTKESGSGMGLYVARLVLEAHGGDIHVENCVDGGARFSLSLPLTQS